MPDPVRRADRRAFAAIARTRLPGVGGAMRALSSSADGSRLWLGIAGVLAVSGGRRGRRAALRGVATVGLTSLVANVPAKQIAGRGRPDLSAVPELRRLATVPTSTSFPSGHAASALAFATAVGLEEPRLRRPLLVLAGAVALSRVSTGVHYPGDVLVGGALGVATARLCARWWPRPPAAPTPARGEVVEVDEPVAPDGTGLVVVANVAAGNTLSAAPEQQLREALPGARLQEIEEGEELPGALRRAAGAARVLGVAGGDGSTSAAAQVAAEHGVPLLVVPAGTLNHFAGDAGLQEVAATVAAVRQGRYVRICLGEIDGRAYLNVASLGLYPALVAAREGLESRLGKWPAALISAARLLATEVPTDLEIDGRRRRVWLVQLGNGRFVDEALAPRHRERLDEPVIDVRVVGAERPWARTRVVVAALAGRLASCPVYERRTAAQVRIRSHQGPLQLAKDGETWSGPASLTVRTHDRRLLLLQPRA